MFQPPFINIIDPTATRLRAVDNGFVYLGKEDTDPTIPANQIPVYYVDENGTTQQLSQPIQLNGSGVPVLSKSSGTIINPIFYADVASIVIRKKGNRPSDTVYSNKNYPALSNYFTHLFSASGYKYSGQWAPNIQIPAKADRDDNYALWEPKDGKIIVPTSKGDGGFTTGATFEDDFNNGYWFVDEIVTKNRLNKLLGDASEFDSLQDAFDYAKDNGINLYSTSDLEILSTVNTYGVDFDFSNVTLKIKTGFSGNYGLSCIDPDKQVINNFDLGTFEEWQTNTPSLSGYGVCTAMIESTEQAYSRAGGGNVNKADILNLCLGYHPTTPALFDITTSVTLTILPRRNTLNMSMPSIVFEDTTQELRAVLYIERNDVVVSAGYEQLLNNEKMRGFVEAKGTTKTVINGAVTSFQDDSFGYLFNGTCCNNVTIEKCNAPKGWRVVDGNFLKNIFCTESEGNSFGAHAMVHNFSADRCKTYASLTRGGGVNVMGRGLLSVTNHSHVVTAHDAESTVNTQYPVSTRADYGQAWDGDIVIDEMDILVTGEVTGRFRVLDVAVARLDGAKDLTKDAVAGKNITVKNIRLKNDSSSPLKFNAALLNTAYKQPIFLPESVTVDNIDLSGPIDSVNYAMFGAQTNPNIRQTLSKFNIFNVDNPTNNTEFSVVIGGSVRDSVKNRIEYQIYRHSGLRCNFNLPPNYSIEVDDSTINEFDCDKLADEDFGKYKISNSTVNPQNIGCGARGGSTNTIMKLLNNEFTYVGAIKMGHGIKWCSGNVAPAGSSLIGGGPSNGAELFSLKTGFL